MQWNRFRAAAKERVEQATVGNREDLRLEIVYWIEATYHRRRRKAALGKLTPIEFERIQELAATAA